MPEISPSILSADFGRLNDEIADVEKHADSLHVDVMDGHFVDNLTIGPVVVRNIKTKLPIDVHLMIDNPLRYVPDFANYCRSISFHAELFSNKKELLKAIDKVKEYDLQVGLALNPDKPVSLIKDVLDKIDYVLIMSVYAGFGGQEFIPEVLEKIKELRNKYRFKKDILIDGGINLKTIKMARDAGANVFVAGTAVFGKQDRKRAIEDLRSALK
ncbi:MAG: ribulose-phosphate 3-epimerase [archaeon]